MKNRTNMRALIIVSTIGIAVAISSCNNGIEQHADIGQTTTDMIFPKGEKITNDNFIGAAWLNYLVETDSVHNTNIGSVTFEPGARTNWHYHKGGQILLVTEGKGSYQERGKSVKIIQQGDIVKCPPNVEHWHGATPTDAMTHIAIGTNTNIGGAVWLEPVTDEEYSYSK